MEVKPQIFDSITHFSISNVKKYHPYFDVIKEIAIEIETRNHGKHSLILFKPFPPLGRPGDKLDILKSLKDKPEVIESIWVFQKRDDVKKARIEIRGKVPNTNIFIKCDRIQGLPHRDKIQASP